MRLVKYLYLVFSLSIALSCIHAVTTNALADWSEGSYDVQVVGELQEPGCEKSDINVVSSADPVIPGNVFSTQERACVVQGAAVDFAYGSMQNFIRFHGNDYYHRFGGSLGAKLLPKTDILLQREPRQGSYVPTKLVIYKDISQNLIEGSRNNFGIASIFYPDGAKGEQQLVYTDSANNIIDQRSVLQFAVSPSGKFVLAYADNLDLVAINVLDGSTRIVAKLPLGQYVTVFPYMAISGDGKYVFIDNLNRLFGGDDCGDVEKKPSMSYYMSNPCPEYSFGEKINGILGYYPTTSYVNFIDNDTSVEMIVSSSAGTSIKKVVLKLLRSYPVLDQYLDYLALGDSYSSGEGDLGSVADGSSFYLPGTEGTKGCHVSLRSYPFLLAQRVGLNDGKMESVACSGARVSKDYFGDGANYFGHGDRLKGKAAFELETIRAEALNNFDPGFIKQIDFVRQFKPKVVTLTGGGNDVGFVDVLKSCVFASGLSDRARTCDEAVMGSKKRTILGDSIRSQYDQITAMIKALKVASPETTVYVLGYPKFTANGPATCVNAALLSSAERNTINASVSYMNQVLAAAARASGAMYISLEDSLAGGRLCEGSEYMTGFLNVFTQSAQTNNMFHPNSAGHSKMADTIMTNGFHIEPNKNPAPVQAQAPDKPTTFGNGAYVPTFQEKLISGVNSVIEVAKLINLSTPITTVLSAGDRVSFTLYSEPVNLGTYVVPSSGVINASVKLPKNLTPGMHMIVAEVYSQGKIVSRFYEYVEITSGLTNDVDGDGIKDDKDPCSFVDNWYDETSKQNICKTATSQPNPGSGSHTNLPPKIKAALMKYFSHHWKVWSVWCAQLHTISGNFWNWYKLGWV